MPPEAPIEQRLSAVEAAVADLQRRLPLSPSAPIWLEQVIGSFKDEPAFAEVLAYGREFRAASRPPGNNGP
jgi:hypothetical protein